MHFVHSIGNLILDDDGKASKVIGTIQDITDNKLKEEQILWRIKDFSLIKKAELLCVSISFGYETKINDDDQIKDIFKKAEDQIYYHKLFESPSMRGKTIDTIIKTLYEKNKREEQHSHRVSKICETMGEVLGLSEYKIKELKTVGLLHDIGKIAISDSYDAMTSERSYRSKMSAEAVLAELLENAGIQFDPELVRLFVENILGKCK